MTTLNIEMLFGCIPISALVSAVSVPGTQLPQRCDRHAGVINSVLSWCNGEAYAAGPPGNIACTAEGHLKAPNASQCAIQARRLNEILVTVVGAPGTLLCLDDKLVISNPCEGNIGPLTQLAETYMSNWTTDKLVACNPSVYSTPAAPTDPPYTGAVLVPIATTAGANLEPNPGSDSSSSDDDLISGTFEITVAAVLGFALVLILVLIFSQRRKRSDVNLALGSDMGSNQPSIAMTPLGGGQYWSDPPPGGVAPSYAEVNVDQAMAQAQAQAQMQMQMQMQQDRPRGVNVAIPARGSAAATMANRAFAKPFTANGGYNYKVASKGPVMPFTTPTAFEVMQLTSRTTAQRTLEYAQVTQMCETYRPVNANPKFIDDYNLARGLVVSTGNLSWSAVWSSAASVLVVLPAADEPFPTRIVPAAGETQQRGRIRVYTNHTSAASLDNVVVYNISMQNAAGEERHVVALQPRTWAGGISRVQTLGELMAAANQSRRPGAAVFVHDIPGGQSTYPQQDPISRPSPGAFTLSWLCIAQALDTGLIDKARTLLLLRSQDRELLSGVEEYSNVQNVLAQMLITIPIMDARSQSPSQRYITAAVHGWRPASMGKIDRTVGHIDQAAMMETSGPTAAAPQMAKDTVSGMQIHVPDQNAYVQVSRLEVLEPDE
jgi:hypothetical protein